jgi:hypothetical protein
MTIAPIPVLAPQWRAIVEEKLPLLGHRNWIVVADSAYPWPASAGIDTVATGSDHLEVLRGVLEAVARFRHVRPIVHTDAELPFVAEAHAPGVTAYRAALGAVLAGKAPLSLPHEEMIALLDEAGRQFRVLLLKTTLTLPYTSVFVRLDCGYWSAEAEKALRATIEGGSGPRWRTT